MFVFAFSITVEVRSTPRNRVMRLDWKFSQVVETESPWPVRISIGESSSQTIWPGL
jgi:hypothetical protein